MSVTEELLLRIAVEGGAVAAGEVDAFNARIAETEAATGRARGGLSRLGGALTSMKALFLGMGVAAAAKQFMDFQATMERLRTQTGSTQLEVKRASDGILHMAVSVGTGPNSLAQAMYHIESAGYRGKTALDALRIAAQGAQVGGADLTDTTTALTAVLVAGFGKGKGATQQLRNAMGELNATVGAGDMTMQDLNDALSTGLLATIKTLGLSVKDAGAALAVLGDNNIRGAQAATRLRMGLMQVIHPSSTVAKNLAAIGMGQFSLAEDLRKPNGLLVMLQDLHKHLGPLTTNAEKTRAADILGGIFGGGRNSSAMLTLLMQMDRLKSKYDAVGKGAHSFGEDWKATTKTLRFFIDQAKALAEVWLIKLGAGLQTVAQWIMAVIHGFKHGKVWAVALVGAIAGLAAAIIIIQGVTAAMVILGALASPFVWIPMAIGALVLLIVKVKSVREWVLNAWHNIKDGAVDVFNWIKDHWKILAVILLGPWGLLLDFVVTNFKTIKGIVKGVIGFFHTSFGRTLLDVLVWPFKTMWSILKAIFNAIVSAVRWVAHKVGSILGAILGPIKSVAGFLGNVGGGALHAVGSLFGLAGGGTVSSSGAFMVGERGPEIVYLPKGAAVQPNHQLGATPAQPSILEATLVNVMDGRVVSRSVVRQGLMASARRGGGGAVLTDAG